MVHLLPFYQETLKHYFNLNRDYQVQCTEMNLDYMDELDTTHPLEALATKMLNNLYNGPYEKKANMVVKLAKEMHADGVINFCHWGCKQSAGGVFQLRETLKPRIFHCSFWMAMPWTAGTAMTGKSKPVWKLFWKFWIKRGIYHVRLCM